MKYGFQSVNDHGLRPVSINELTRKKSCKIIRNSISIPSQQQAYAVCVEFARNWFLEKFKPNYFNSIYINTTHSFDEFRKFSQINQQMKRANPLLAIVPTIDINHNRQWIDSQPEFPLLLKRSRIEGTFFNDNKKGLYIQLIPKTILMNFTYKIRLDTRAEQLDMMEFIKLNHRAGWTENRELLVDIHVPKPIILQIAFDNGFAISANGEIKDPIGLLNYLNSHSYVPFIYKLRCSTGNKEFFIKVPNCMAHIKSELPTMDDGERQDTITTNYNIEFTIEIEMTAPYCYTYFSQNEQPYILNAPQFNNYDKIAIMAAVKTELPCIDQNNWDQYVVTEYEIDEEDINKPLVMDFNELFKDSEITKIIDYTKSIAVNPSIFMNFIIYNNAVPVRYSIDWNNMLCNVIDPISNTRTIIGIYCDKKYINDTLLYITDAQQKNARVE